MADVRPFRAIRYDLEHTGTEAFSDVVSPPYDVIDDAMLDELYERHPNNFVRIDLNRERAEDDDENNRYTRARRIMSDWLAAGVLTRDETPSVYAHHQTFTDELGDTHTRAGFLAVIRLAEYDEEIVLPHERTLRGPKEDRLKLMEATEANLSPVFMLYDDEDSVIDSAVETAIEAHDHEPAIARTDDGIVHETWRVDDESAQRTIRDFLRDRSVLIADGHHRYETALAYRDLRRESADDSDPDAPYEYALAFFVNYRDPGLRVFPTHRVVYGLDEFSFEDFITELGDNDEFTVSRIAGGRSEELLRKALQDGGKRSPSFVMNCKGCAPALVSFTGTHHSHIFDDDTPNEVRRLDVAILHEGIFDTMLGITKEAQEAKTNLKYVKSFDAAMAAGDDADNQLVVLMNPTPVEQVDEVCRSGGKMPQKSTYFYPKVLSGLAINPL